MSIYEYDQEKHIQQEKESSWKDGHAIGIEVGEKQKLLKMIRKKLEKGKDAAQIAEELEETEENIRKLMEEL